MMDAQPRSRALVSVLAANPDFRLFWTGNLISSSGVWMQNLAQGWLILELSDSPFLLGVAGFASLIPTLALSLIGGTVADRVDRRRVLMSTQAALMFLALLLALLTRLGVVTPVQILIIILLSGVATALNSPAYQASIPDLVRKEDLSRAIALNSVQFNVARIVGHSVAGVLVARLGEATCFFINGLTYLGMLCALWFIRLPSRHIPRDSVSFWTRFGEGIRYVTAQKTAGYLIAMMGIISFLGLPYFFLLPAIGRDVLGQDAGGVGYLMGSVSLGALIGALAISRMSERFGKEPMARTAGILFWIALLGFSFSRTYWLSVFLLIVLGFVLVLTVVTVNNLLQVLAPPEMRGRVMGIYTMVLNGLAPLGSLVAGSLAEATSTAMAVRSMAAVGLVLGAFVVFRLSGQPELALEQR